jgi:hypothetical protein
MEPVMKSRIFHTQCQFSPEFAAICRAAVIAALLQQYLAK